jgi:hypothetical protein
MPTEEPKTQDTADINLAVYIKEVENIETAGHYFKGKQLWIQFAVSKADMRRFKDGYINHLLARCDATRKNFLQLLK